MKRQLIMGTVIGISVFLFSVGYGQENNPSPSISERAKEASHLYLEADKLAREGKYTEAITAYKKIAENP